MFLHEVICKRLKFKHILENWFEIHNFSVRRTSGPGPCHHGQLSRDYHRQRLHEGDSGLTMNSVLVCMYLLTFLKNISEILSEAKNKRIFVELYPPMIPSALFLIRLRERRLPFFAR